MLRPKKEAGDFGVGKSRIIASKAPRKIRRGSAEFGKSGTPKEFSAATAPGVKRSACIELET